MTKPITKAQFSLEQMRDLRQKAESQSTSVSSIIEDAVKAFLKEGKSLPKLPKAGSPFCGFTLDQRYLTKVKAMSEESNLSWNQAIRYIVEDYLHNAVHSTTPVKSDNI